MRIEESKDIRPECNFCFNTRSPIFELEGGGFLVVSICSDCINEIKQII